MLVSLYVWLLSSLDASKAFYRQNKTWTGPGRHGHGIDDHDMIDIDIVS